jgi:2-methylcitrate dehydratase PrpD
MSETSFTHALASFIQQQTPTLSAEVRRRSVRCLVDTFAVMLAGSREAAVQLLQRTLTEDRSGLSLPWTSTRLRAEDACLLAGMASHILDYDDVCMLAVCHPSAPVFAALFALARQQRLSGAELVTCHAIGTEVMLRCGQALGFRHYDLGFHATGTLGVLGATAACARASRLSVEQTIHALSIAGSYSAGLQVNFGSMMKSLHVGLAAGNALRAVRLAQAGLTGAADLLSGKGWLHAFSGGNTSMWPDQVRLGEPYALASPGFEQKRYPCCYMMHKIIRATLELRDRHQLRLDGLKGATVTMPRGGSSPLIHPTPQTGLSGKFSGTYAVAASLRDGRVQLSSFTDHAVKRADIQAALSRVELVEAGQEAKTGSDVGSAPVTVTLRYASGAEYSRTVTASPGSPEDPISDSDLHEKWLDCLRVGLPSLDRPEATTLFEQGIDIESCDDVADWLNPQTAAISTR